MNAAADRNSLHQRWVHSHEEDTPTEMVFRPASFRFPRSRGRRAFELAPDGRLVEIAIGPTDRPEEVLGAWELEDDRTLVLHSELAPESRQVMRIVSIDGERLVVKR